MCADGNVDYQTLLTFSQPGLKSFILPLGDIAPVYSEEVVRVVPGQRIVAKGIWRDQPVYIKIFIGERRFRHYSRDLRGVSALFEAKIATPVLLYSGQAENGAYVMILAALERAANAEQVLAAGDFSVRRELMSRLVKTIAAHHNAGLLQADLYPRNFLIDGEITYTIDGDAIKPIVFNNAKAAAENLAKLLASLDVMDMEKLLPELVSIYQLHSVYANQIDLRQLLERALSYRARVIRAYAEKKVFRQCTDIKVTRFFDRFSAINRIYAIDEIERIFNDLDDFLDGAEGVLLKKGNTCTVGAINIAGKKLVLKRYNIKNICHFVMKALRKGRAAISWSNAFRLGMYGIATAKPVSLYEKRWGPLRLQTYLITEYLDAPDIDAYFKQNKANQSELVSAAENIARMFYKLKLLKISHGDFKASNMKIVDRVPYLIDLDSMQEHASQFIATRLHVSDMRRLMQNWPENSWQQRLLAGAFQKVYQDDRLLKKAGIANQEK